jgi:hypothetical protein
VDIVEVGLKVKVKPGLASSQFTTIAEAVNSVQSLFALGIDPKVPAELRSSTPVLMVGTGGVRALASTDPTRAEELLQGVRTLLAASGYYAKPHFVTLLSGEQEGAYAWLAANHLLGTPGALTVVEVGGATLQVASSTPALTEHAPSGAVLDRYFPLSVYTTAHDLYANSWNELGRDEALRLHREYLMQNASAAGLDLAYDPCVWSGYVRLFSLIKETLATSPSCKSHPFCGVHFQVRLRGRARRGGRQIRGGLGGHERVLDHGAADVDDSADARTAGEMPTRALLREHVHARLHQDCLPAAGSARNMARHGGLLRQRYQHLRLVR